MILERLNLLDLLDDEMKELEMLEQKRKALSMVVGLVSGGSDGCSVEPARQEQSVDNASSVVEVRSVNQVNDKETQSVTDGSKEGKFANNDDEIKTSSDVGKISAESTKANNEKSECEIVDNEISKNIQSHDISNVSLSDMFNSSDEDTLNSCKEFPHVGLSLGTVSQTSLQSSSELDPRNFKMGLFNTSTPLRIKAHTDKEEIGTRVKSREVEGSEKLKEVTASTKPVSAFKSVIRQTIENRLTQVPRISDETKDVKEKVEAKSTKSKLVCVKEKRSTNIGESANVSGKVKKSLTKYERNKKEKNIERKTADKGDTEISPEKITDVKRKRTSSDNLSDSDENCEYANTQKKRKGIRTDRDFDTLSQNTNKDESESNLNASKSNKNCFLKTKTISGSTLSKLKKFQFDESKSNILNGSVNSEPCMTETLLSGSCWVNANDRSDRRENLSNHNISFEENAESVSGKSECASEKQRSRIETSSFENDFEKILKSTTNAEELKTADTFQKPVVTSTKQSQKKNESPSWLVTLNKKFSSPSITTSCTPFSSSVFSVNDGKDTDDDNFEDSTFLTKLQTVNTIKK